MSQYMIERIKRSPHISLHTDTVISRLEGETALEFVTRTNRTTGESVRMPVPSVFVMIGADPNSGWSHGSVKLDAKGFVLTGDSSGFEVTPYATSIPGIYAVGDHKGCFGQTCLHLPLERVRWSYRISIDTWL